MRARLLALRRSITTTFDIKSRKYASKPRCDAHMNELPIPCGPWEIYYKDRQAAYNKILVAGILWWLISLAALIYTESVYFNWAPPDMPGPPSDMAPENECED